MDVGIFAYQKEPTMKNWRQIVAWILFWVLMASSVLAGSYVSTHFNNPVAGFIALTMIGLPIGITSLFAVGLVVCLWDWMTKNM